MSRDNQARDALNQIAAQRPHLSLVPTIELGVSVRNLPVVGISNSLSRHLLAEFFDPTAGTLHLDKVLSDIAADAPDGFGVTFVSTFTPVGDVGPKPLVRVLIETWPGLNAAIMSHDPIVKPERTGIIHYELPENTPPAAVDEEFRSAAIRDAGT